MHLYIGIYCISRVLFNGFNKHQIYWNSAHLCLPTHAFDSDARFGKQKLFPSDGELAVKSRTQKKKERKGHKHAMKLSHVVAGINAVPGELSQKHSFDYSHIFFEHVEVIKNHFEQFTSEQRKRNRLNITLGKKTIAWLCLPFILIQH